ncbi:MAG: pitrilysin family protein [Pseudomonadota bacterium]
MTVFRMLAMVAAAATLTLVQGVATEQGLAARAEQPITTFQLENGMDVVVIEDHRAPVVTHMVWYRVGAADEQRGVSGIAHFLEHLMFKGTDEIPDGAFSKIIAANGGQDNAFTARDYTGYFQRIAADRLELVMKMEADRMVDVVITEDHVRTEREVIIEERNSRVDNSPDGLFGEQLQAALFMNHPYGTPIIGWRHEMEQLSLDDALTFYERYYAPDNAILIVAGDVTVEAVRALAETYYGPLEPSGRPADPRPSEPPQLAPRRIAMEDPRVRQDYVMRRYLVPAYDPADPLTSAALSAFASILGSGVTSRLSQTLELDDKIAISTGAWYSPRSRDLTEFTMFGVPAEGYSLADVEAAMDATMAELIENGPTEEELARIKRIQRASRVFAQDNVGQLARLYGASLAMGFSVEDVRAWPDIFDFVTIEDVKRVAAEQIQLRRSVTGTLRRSVEG